jgi:hypothetical protein
MAWAERGCHGKIAYLSKRDAKRGVESLRSKEQRRGNPTDLHIYRCPPRFGGCGYHHIGHEGAEK